MKRALVGPVLALALLAGCAAGAGEVMGPRPAAAASGPACPVATCLSNVYITDGAQGMGSPFTIEDNEGHPPGRNAIMFFVDGFEADGVNPMCGLATVPYLAREACIGGPPFNATGARPVLALSPDHGKTWVVIGPAQLARLLALLAAGLTPADVRALHRVGL